MSTKKTTKTKAQAEPAKKTPKVSDETPKAAPTEPKAPKTKPAEKKPKKVSAIDAAARVLGEAKEQMNCQALIKVMADKGYWTSPGGKTPHATLYSAILREIGTKGKDSRFKKTERGKFAANS
jgi:outer membrane biosynthesis protein TonB